METNSLQELCRYRLSDGLKQMGEVEEQAWATWIRCLLCRQNLLPHSQRFEYVTTDLADRIRMLKKDTSTTTQATTPTPTDQRNLKNHKRSISSADVGCGAGSEVGSGSCSFGVQSSTRPVNHTYDHPVARDIARTCRSKKPTANPPRNAINQGRQDGHEIGIEHQSCRGISWTTGV